MKRVGMITEIDQAVMNWLETHHIRAKDVRAYTADGRVSDRSVITLEVFVSGVDEIPASGGIVRGKASIVGESGPEEIVPPGDRLL